MAPALPPPALHSGGAVVGLHSGRYWLELSDWCDGPVGMLTPIGRILEVDAHRQLVLFELHNPRSVTL